MKKIGLTGNIASGKTTAENIIKKFGYKVIDADEICHELLESDIYIITEVKKLLENYDIMDEKNNISRKKIGEIVFNSEILRKKLENILHPAVFDAIDKFFDENLNEKFIFVSIPLLFETNCEELFDKIIFISSGEKIRLKRLIKRNNLSESEAIARINSQQSEKIKIDKSDFIIYNNGNFDEFEKNTEDVLRKLCGDCV